MAIHTGRSNLVSVRDHSPISAASWIQLFVLAMGVCKSHGGELVNPRISLSIGSFDAAYSPIDSGKATKL